MNKIIICGIGVSVIILILGVIYLPDFIKATIFYADRDRDIALAKKIIDDRDCWGVKDLIRSGEITSARLKMTVAGFSDHCNSTSAEINDEGIDISGKYNRNDSILK